MAVRRVEMHAGERRADGICHDIRNRLSAAFITPIDQEDILHLAQLLDDVTDALDEVALECYMFRLAELPAGAPAFAGLTRRCVGKLCEAAIELRNFRSSGRLRALLAEVNTLEEQADDAYATAIHDLFAEDAAPRTLIAGKAIFDCMEACCDLCGHAADVMDQIIIKNTCSGTTPIRPGRSVRPRSCDICRRPQTGSAGAGGMIWIGCSAPRDRVSCWHGSS